MRIEEEWTKDVEQGVERNGMLFSRELIRGLFLFLGNQSLKYYQEDNQKLFIYNDVVLFIKNNN